MFDVAIIGCGPGGGACAASCAQAGLRTLLLERATFPREKVCGDCLNPGCADTLRRLDLVARLRALPHGRLRAVEFVSAGGRAVRVMLPGEGEIALKRSAFDQLLMTRAMELGGTVRTGTTVTGVVPPVMQNGSWHIKAGPESFHVRILVAADGRNSTVARLLGILPKSGKERVALQTHLPLPRGFGERVVLQFLPGGYSGQAPVDNETLNVCLVGMADDLPALRTWAEQKFALSPEHAWRTITPLRRAAIPPAGRRLFFVGDAARVVEPFTGEGIYYALRSGELAAEAIVDLLKRGDEAAAQRAYTKAHEKLYRGRLWINRVARSAVLAPRVTSALLRAHLLPRPLLAALTKRVAL